MRPILNQEHSAATECLPVSCSRRGHWEPLIKTWFTEGVDDPRTTALCFTPGSGYYWDTKHGSVVAGVNMIRYAHFFEDELFCRHVTKRRTKVCANALGGHDFANSGRSHHGRSDGFFFACKSNQGFAVGVRPWCSSAKYFADDLMRVR